MRLFVIGILMMLTATALAADNPTPAADRDYYTMRQYLVTRDGTDNLIATLRFDPVKDWKWNAKYPTKFTIKEDSHGKLPYHLVGEHIELVDESPVQVWLELKPSASAKAMRQRFTVTAAYSFCNKLVCRTFKRDIDF